MDESVVSIPVACPKCGNEHLAEIPAVVLELALSKWNNIRLHASCHEESWDASQAEIEKIRAYLRDAGATIRA